MKDKIALVTGGTSGIGKEIVKELLNEGLKIIIVYGHNVDQMNSTKNEFKEFENSLFFIQGDVSKENEVKELFEEVSKRYNCLDFLINNAGTNVDEDIENASLETYMKVVNTNYIGKMLCIKYATPLLKKSSYASIINIASSLGIKADTECSAYCCSAAAIIKLTECAALELSKYNIRVNTVSPAFTPTPLSLAGWTEEEIKAKKERNSRHRLGKVEDIANVVLFLISDKADYINGENIRVNGGSLLK